MIKAKEALQTVKETEEEANHIVKLAKQEATQLLQNAELLAEKEYDQILTSGKKQAEKIKDYAISKGDEEGKAILTKGLKDAESIRHIDTYKLKQAVDIIVERIVENNGYR